ncbi:glutathione S-transferase family protein [Sphingomonas sp. SUN019]|uniref:glutathione S-transferase family protein n=1 Tax=Sphingomonas sp. SUN019 TaxID=2937788 RepID=UPI002164604F|nr:glutathione S-transferase family protein [Sphingomonas sp. SUN019]UVO49833.1 glutathione S-transferase family protein [Sphingomonas sp. SUN019]
MKLYTSIGPNPRVVTIFLAEKGVDLPTEKVDIMAGDNRRAPYTGTNPASTTPALMLDDGDVVSEITAICEYLDELHPEPPLIGATPAQRAATRMWVRRIDLTVTSPMTFGFRGAEGLKMFEQRLRCVPEASPGMKACAQDGLAFIDAQMAGRDYIAGDRLTLADILLFAFVEFGSRIGQPLDAAHGNLAAWYERLKARPAFAG